LNTWLTFTSALPTKLAQFPVGANTDGALYQVYTSPGRVTVIALQEGEELVTVSAGDTVRWIVGDTASGAGTTLRVNILVKPTRIG
jgi:type IV secretory pathway VirB9-like protein